MHATQGAPGYVLAHGVQRAVAAHGQLPCLCFTSARSHVFFCVLAPVSVCPCISLPFSFRVTAEEEQKTMGCM